MKLHILTESTDNFLSVLFYWHLYCLRILSMFLRLSRLHFISMWQAIQQLLWRCTFRHRPPSTDVCILQDAVFINDKCSRKIDPFLMHDQLFGNTILGAYPRCRIGEKSKWGFQLLPPVCHTKRLLRIDDQDLGVTFNKLLICFLELSQFPIADRSPIRQQRNDNDVLLTPEVRKLYRFSSIIR